ncbi:hypothetical protein BEP19_05630 [Ammoniphilus oxalaticus]|uniref:SpoOB alpha-helical domain-containing protein n=1 Tax=Ammoniphilus oxalaticus TaxID=66863 RepID=A0A419SIW4_9BACL|nr:Spo0B domain-containing protein [Ammoniphilus oxalaticus]RKD23907.1 hypothetical protein BEP19_05630 [Ammoniphilus oxalaticus]
MESKRSIDNSIQEEQQKFLTTLSLLRHDLLNHFQVVLGYLKLQRYDLCEEYIMRVTENANNDSRISSLGISPLVAYLLTYNALHPELKLEVEVPEIVNLARLPEENQQQISQLVIGVVESYQQHGLFNQGQPNTLVVVIKSLDQKLYISAEYEGFLNEQACLQSLRSLAQQLGDEEGLFVEGLHNKRESIMEFYVPLSIEAEVKG